MSGAAPMAAQNSGPLQGVRIIDCTHALAGPWSTMMLADLGADVIKVEPPRGELARKMPPFTREDTERNFGAGFANYNRNKRGIALDLTDDDQREQFLQLVDTADALVENMRAGVMDALGVGWEVLHERNPRLVYGAIRGFGDPRSGESPYVDWPAYDVVAQAMSGMVSATGSGPDDRHVVGPYIGDTYPGTIGAMGGAGCAVPRTADRRGAVRGRLDGGCRDGAQRGRRHPLQRDGPARYAPQRQQEPVHRAVRHLRHRRRGHRHRRSHRQPLARAGGCDGSTRVGLGRRDPHPAGAVPPSRRDHRGIDRVGCDAHQRGGHRCHWGQGALRAGEPPPATCSPIPMSRPATCWWRSNSPWVGRSSRSRRRFA